MKQILVIMAFFLNLCRVFYFYSRGLVIMSNIKKYLCFCVLLVVANTVLAKETAFRHLELSGGISLDVPTHWHILSLQTKKNIVAASEAMISNSGLEEPMDTHEKLLAVNATPSPTGAMISVAVSSPSVLSQADLINSTESDLKSFELNSLNEMKALENFGGPTVIKMLPARIDIVNKKYALVLSYIRRGVNNPEIPWKVELYKIPDSTRLIEVILSYRMSSDSVAWKPILERVKRSVRF